MSVTNKLLNISLEAHLQDALTPLLRVLPEEISQRLSLCLAPETNATAVPVIPYELVLQISRWSQTLDGKAALQSCSPPLDSQSYTMVSLLAGTRTSPEKHFPPYISKDPEEEQHLQTKDRKAIATLVNAILSIVGTGIATWWAGEHTGMQLEWRALSAICAALLVALAEIVLYIIWDSRQASPPRQSGPARILVQHKVSMESGSTSDPVPKASSTALGATSLRHRSAISRMKTAVS